MTFLRVVKNKAYFRRFQVKFRRRREGKTDYYARKRLVAQDKNKYDSPKYRLVVRLTNRRVICQVVSATLVGDRVHASADSAELVHYGVKVGLTNYAAAYCTGLLLARRLLAKLKLDSQFVGKLEVDGELYHVEEEESERRPFKALLDVGVKNVTTGNRVFGALKGACDGGLHVPHSEKRFPGYSVDEENNGSYDAQAHRDRIFGAHVASYMEYLREEDPDKYQRQFSAYLRHGLSGSSLEAMYAQAHASIRANPLLPPKPRKAVKHVRQGSRILTSKGSYVRNVKISKAQRRDRVKQKIAMLVNES